MRNFTEHTKQSEWESIYTRRNRFPYLLLLLTLSLLIADSFQYELEMKM